MEVNIKVVIGEDKIATASWEIKKDKNTRVRGSTVFDTEIRDIFKAIKDVVEPYLQ